MKRLLKSGMIGKKLLSSSPKIPNENHVPHFHDFYEIEYVISGNGRSTINGKEILCSAGLLCFSTPLDCHSVQTDGMEVINIMSSEQLVDFRYLEPFLRYSSPKSIAVQPEIRAFVESILSEIVLHEDNLVYSAVLLDCLLLKLAQLVLLADGNHTGSVFSEIHGYITNHYRSNRLNLEAVAAHAGRTPSYVSALFKKEMHIGRKAYIQSLRLEYAKKLLISTEESVRQICEESGFEDFPNFIKQFKAYHKMTPTELRKIWGRTWKEKQN